jgi:hypothetical protein
MSSAKSKVVLVAACVCMLLVGAGFGRTPANKGAKIARRGDVRNLPDPLKQRIVELAGRPHSTVPTQAFA